MAKIKQKQPDKRDPAGGPLIRNLSLLAHNRADAMDRVPNEGPTNLARASSAIDVLQHYGVDSFGSNGDEDLTTVMGDLICDLMHMSKIVGYDFNRALEAGRNHFNAEMSNKAELAKTKT